MLDSATTYPKIVFLHIPKTAGQTVHNALAQAVGAPNVSPIRVHTQTKQGGHQFPAGYRLYSGHIDWSALDAVPKPRFVFSILRDPRERIASFYFYLLKEAKKLNEAALNTPQNAGKKTILTHTADDYFFGGSDAWRAFVQDHYDNFYCRYFGSRRIRAGSRYSAKTNTQKIRMALRNLEQVDWVYSIENLRALEQDLHTLFGFQLSLQDTHHNIGDHPQAQHRWPRLLSRFEKDISCRKIEEFITLDRQLMDKLEL